MKALLVTVLSYVAAFSVVGLNEDGVVAGLGVMGLSALIHRLHRLLGAIGDEKQILVVSKSGQRKVTGFL